MMQKWLSKDNCSSFFCNHNRTLFCILKIIYNLLARGLKKTHIILDALPLTFCGFLGKLFYQGLCLLRNKRVERQRKEDTYRRTMVPPPKESVLPVILAPVPLLWHCGTEICVWLKKIIINID